MSVTHGWNYKSFNWQLTGNTITIKNENNRDHNYNLNEVFKIINWLAKIFDKKWFPLANNVKLMGRGEEIPGLGVAILNLDPTNITHAQGASYLGVVLEEVKIFQWNRAKKGIKWCIVNRPASIEKLTMIIKDYLA